MNIDITTISQERLEELEILGKEVFGKILTNHSEIKDCILNKDLIMQISTSCENEHEVAITCFTLGYQIHKIFGDIT